MPVTMLSARNIIVHKTNILPALITYSMVEEKNIIKIIIKATEKLQQIQGTWYYENIERKI